MKWIKRLAVAVFAMVALLVAGVAAASWRGWLPPLPVLMHALSGRAGPPQQDMPIDEATRREVLQQLTVRLRSHYVFPDKAEVLVARLNEQAPRYAGITSAQDFAEAVTKDMRELVRDGHLALDYSEQPVPADALDADERYPKTTPEMHAEMQRHNFGFERLERLSFNLGYLQLSAFAPEVEVRVAAAMTLMADTRALIIDLRGCRGGDPRTVAALASYFFDQRTHLNDFVGRDGRVVEEMHTAEQVAGPRYGAERPVYILTDGDTFSAAEDFAYAMKHLKRAVLVGETTGGGAHPGRPHRLAKHFSAFIPNERSQSPITQGNWEGTGVAPDVAVSAGDALDAAQVLALKARLASEPDEAVKRRMEQRIARLE
jgi:hypothetical protein